VAVVEHKRRSERRVDLIAAAQRAMLRHGAEVPLKEVAREAGLTSGAVLYHYGDLRELLAQAHRAGMDRFHAQRAARIADIDDPAEQLRVTIASGLPTGADDADVRLLCELGGAAGRNPLYADLLTELYDRQVGLYEAILAAGVVAGVFTLAADPTTIARNLVALEDAYGYRIIAGHPVIGPAQAVGLVLGYARTMTGYPL
jgi:AcrR family transcriptional regulator